MINNILLLYLLGVGGVQK